MRDEDDTDPDGLPVRSPSETTGKTDIHALPGYDVGCRACYGEGQEDALIALRSLLLQRGAPDDEVEAVVAAVRARLVAL